MTTLKDIAADSGFSVSAVSAVLNGKSKHNIPIKTQNKIKESARRLKYKPNISARKLRQGQNQSVIMIFWANDNRDTMMTRFLKGINQQIKQSNEVEIIFNFYKPGTLKQAKNLLDASYCNAAIICNTSQSDLDYLESTEFTIPIVLYNRKSAKYCNVVVDPYKIGEMAARTLGYTNKAYYLSIGEEHKYPGSSEREVSFWKLLKENDVPNKNIDTLILKDFSNDSYLKIKKCLSQLDKPINVFCLNDRIAVLVIKAIHQLGLKINCDVSLISVGNEDPFLSSNIVPAISTIEIPIEKMASKCFEIINKKIQEDLYQETTELDVTLVTRDTTRK